MEISKERPLKDGIKDRNDKDLQEAEESKKRWEKAQKNCKKRDLNDKRF